MPSFRFYKLLPVLWLFCALSVSAQINPLLEQIADLQSRGDAFYRDGMFATNRWNGKATSYREDNNIFFTALTVHTLQSLYHVLNNEEQKLVDTIISRAQANYPHYRNRNGELSYNFWQVYPYELPFPGRKLWSRMRKFRLADDLDDTSLIYLTLDICDSTARAVKRMMEAQIGEKPLKSTFKHHRDYRAYRTWFADKMKQDLDICVMANVLLFVFKKQLPLSQYDQQTIKLITRMVDEEQHLSHPRLVSPHYQQSSVILYHLSRLIAAADHPALDQLKPKVLSDLEDQYASSQHAMEKLILQSSLLRLGKQTTFATGSVQITNQDMEKFYWFYANPFSGSRIFFKKLLGRSYFLQSRYTSEAYYLALILENSLLHRIRQNDILR